MRSLHGGERLSPKYYEKAEIYGFELVYTDPDGFFVTLKNEDIDK